MTDITQPTAATPSRKQQQPMDRDGFIAMVTDAQRLVDNVNTRLADAAGGLDLAGFAALRRLAAAETATPDAEGEAGGKPRKGGVAGGQRRALTRSNLIATGEDGRQQLTDEGRSALAAGESSLDELLQTLTGSARGLPMGAGRSLSRAAKALGKGRKAERAAAAAAGAGATGADADDDDDASLT